VLRMLDEAPPPSSTGGSPKAVSVSPHCGFWDYQEQCHMLAKTHDAAVMAAAVVNWIPKAPFPGKMPTVGYEPGKAEMNIPFILAPRVIDGMRKANPKLTLIGCKMTIGATRDEMIEAAYKTLFWAQCHAVIANDMHAITRTHSPRHPSDLVIDQVMGLRAKTVLYPDRAQFDFDIGAEEGVNFYKHLEAIITDEHFTTVGVAPKQAYDEQRLSDYRYVNGSYDECEDLFDLIADKYRLRFVHKVPVNNHTFSDHAFGALAVRTGTGALVTPRKKTALFSKRDAVDVLYPTDADLKQRRVRVIHHGMHEMHDGKWVESSLSVPKASMNATLLLRHLQAHPSAAAVLHLHEQLPDRPTVPYAPPGTARDNLREIITPAYNIEGHGCIVALDQRGEMYGKWDV
jgi:DNA/pantothenate metabolism flavoprotein